MFNNLLNQALSIIPKQSVTWLQFDGNNTNDFGISEPSYKEPITITGSIQSMTSDRMQRLGLDMNKKTMTLHTSAKVKGNANGQQSDLIEYAGDRFIVITPTDWQAQDGWTQFILVAQ